MSPGLIVFAAILVVAGFALAANFRLAATQAGNYLIGRKRVGLISLRHRRERFARALGCAAAGLGLSVLVSALPGGAAALNGLAFAVGVVATALLWAKTNNVHGKEVPDSEAHKKLL